jgi:hypothetical protein
MNEQPHAPQDSTQGEDKGTSGWKELGIACLLATLVVLSPIGILFLVMQKGYYDARSAREEFTRTVNPDELRAWARMQFKKHPKGGYIKISAEELPKTFPHFAVSRGLSLHLEPSDVDQRHSDVLMVILVWGFSAGYSMSVNVWLNPDGSPADTGDGPFWAKGITIDILSK